MRGRALSGMFRRESAVGVLNSFGNVSRVFGMGRRCSCSVMALGTDGCVFSL